MAGALAAVMLSLAACGDSNDDSGDATASDASDRRQLNQVMGDYRAALAARDGARGCELLAANYREALTVFVKSGPKTCERGFEAFAGIKLSEDLTPRILAVRIDGDRAAVVGWPSHAKERQTARFVREDGGWKLTTWFAS